MRTNLTLFRFTFGPLLFSAGLFAAEPDLRLVEAIRSHDNVAARALLAQHPDVNRSEPDGATPIAWAAHWDDLEMADLLIKAGANLNTPNKFGVTPLWEACSNGSGLMAEKLARAGADPNVVLQGTGETALMKCASTGSLPALKALLEHGANANARELRKGQTALMWALAEHHIDAARLLLEHDADVRIKSKAGFSALFFVASQGDVEAGQLLLQKGADVNDTTPSGLTPLLVAADSGHEQLAVFLVEHGANVNAVDPDGLTAMHCAVRMGISTITSVGRGGKGNYPLADSYLFRPNMTDLVKALLAHGANPNARALKGTKLTADIDPGKTDVTETGVAGSTPFLLAAATSDVPLMKLLLAKGANTRLGTNDGVTPLLAAAGVGRSGFWDRTKEEEKQSIEAIQLMLDLGADVNESTNDGVTALHGAAFSGANDVIRYLVQKGARLDARDKLGQTALSRSEGDPKGLVDYHGRYAHAATAQLIRELTGSAIATASAPTGGN